MKKIVFFDLDGTILDTIGNLTSALNRALFAFGFPRVSVEQATSFLGNGSFMLVRRALGGVDNDELCLSVRERFRQEYEKDMYSLTKPYEGMTDLLAKLKEKGIITAVITNKDDVAAVPMTEHYFGDTVDFCRGVRRDGDRKPNPEPSLSILKNVGLSPENGIFVGDGMADFEVSRALGMDFVPCGYGYTSPEKLFEKCGTEPVSDVYELEKKLLEYLL